MLHAKIIDATQKKIEISHAEKFLSSSKFGAIIYFLGTVRNINENKKVIGIGETGLDYYYENSNRENQTKSFIMHIEIAQELNLPLVIHMRSAESEMIDIIEKYYKKKEFSGVIH